MDKIKDFGLFVTSNASNSHILFGDSNKTPCGLFFEIMDTRYPCSEVRFYLPHDEFKKYVEQNRHFHYQGYRFCKKCLIAFDKLMRGGKQLNFKTDLTDEPSHEEQN